MVLYICERCGYETMRKSNFKSHLNRKKICQPLLEDLDREFIKFKHGFGSKKYEIAELGGDPPKSFKQIHNTTTIFKQKIKQNDPPKTTLFKQKIKQKGCTELFRRSRSDSVKKSFTFFL